MQSRDPPPPSEILENCETCQLCDDGFLQNLYQWNICANVSCHFSFGAKRIFSVLQAAAPTECISNESKMFLQEIMWFNSRIGGDFNNRHTILCKKRLIRCDTCGHITNAAAKACKCDSVDVNQIQNLTPRDTQNHAKCWCDNQTFPNPPIERFTIGKQEPLVQLYVALGVQGNTFTEPKLYKTDNTLYVLRQRGLDTRVNAVVNAHVMRAFGQKLKQDEDKSESSGQYSESAELSHILGQSEVNVDTIEGSKVPRGAPNSPFSSINSEQKLYKITHTPDPMDPEDVQLGENARASACELEGVESKTLPTLLDIFDDNVGKGEHIFFHMKDFPDLLECKAGPNNHYT